MTTEPDTTGAAATAGPALTPEQERAIMERHRDALRMAAAAADRPMALAALCEIALTLAQMATSVGSAAMAGQGHPLGVYVERQATVITAQNGGKERALVGMRIDSAHAIELMNAVADLRADRGNQKPSEEAAAPAAAEPAEDVAPAAPRLHLVGEGANG